MISLVNNLFGNLFGRKAPCGERYQNLAPPFDIKSHFNGSLKGWGIIQDRAGDVVARFEIDMEGHWQGEKGVLKEKFTWQDDGRVQKREWRITQIDNTYYKAEADDIIGEAYGRIFGNAIRWCYVMDVPVAGKKYRLRFDDWIWALEGGAMINRSYFKKFGFVVAELTAFMQRR